MGKGFNNFMSKKDFHPSAIWNLKRVWEARQKQTLDQKKQDEMRAQYEKEQEILTNKAMLGDEKAKLGLSFMYDAPAGMARQSNKEENDEIEPKFEWQRKYNAPREEWAKGNEDILDQPFGIQVRNVRCMKCHTYGHINTDRECPLFSMSGDKEDPGFSTNPSDLIKKSRKRHISTSGDVKIAKVDRNDDEEKEEEHDPNELVSNMHEEYGLKLRDNVMHNINVDQALKKMGGVKVKAEVKTEPAEPNQQQLMLQYMATLSEQERAKIWGKFFNKDKKDKKKKKKKDKKEKKIKKEKKEKGRKRHDSSSENEDEQLKSSNRMHGHARVKAEPESPPSYSHVRNGRDNNRVIKQEGHWAENDRHKPHGQRHTDRRVANGRDDRESPSRQERRQSPKPERRKSPNRQPERRQSPKPERRQGPKPERRQSPVKTMSPPRRYSGNLERSARKEERPSSPPPRKRQPSSPSPRKRRESEKSRSRSPKRRRQQRRSGRMDSSSDEEQDTHNKSTHR